MKHTVTQVVTRKSALMVTSDPFVLKTTLNMQPTHIHELKSAARRTFGLLILEFIWKHLLQPRFGCRYFLPEEHGCDALLTNCTKAPLRPKACIESKYVENFWIKKGTLLQKVKDASSKLRRAESRGFRNRFLLVSSFALKRAGCEGDKLYKEAQQYVIVVLLMKSEIVEENPSYATQEIVDKTKKLTEEEALDPVANLGINLLYDKLADVEAHQERDGETLQTLQQEQEHIKETLQTLQQEQEHIKETLQTLQQKQERVEETLQTLQQKQERVEETLQTLQQKQERVEETLQTLSKAQQEASKKQETMAEDIVELKNLVIEFLKRLDKE